MTNEEQIISKTKEWIANFVIELNLCPFAPKPFEENRIRFVSTDTESEEKLFRMLGEELLYIQEHTPSEVETTVFIHPNTLTEFDIYLDFIEAGNALLLSLGLEGSIQLATFHPDYQFAGTDMDDPSNYTNRSPYPMIHLLRESSISKAVEEYPDLEGIPDRNIARLQGLGIEEIKRIIQGAS